MFCCLDKLQKKKIPQFYSTWCLFFFFLIDPKKGRKEEVGNRSSTELGIWQTVSRISLLELYFFWKKGKQFSSGRKSKCNSLVQIQMLILKQSKCLCQRITKLLSCIKLFTKVIFKKIQVVYIDILTRNNILEQWKRTKNMQDISVLYFLATCFRLSTSMQKHSAPRWHDTSCLSFLWCLLL